MKQAAPPHAVSGKRGLHGRARTEAYTFDIKPLEAELHLCRKVFLEKLNLAVPRSELSIGKKVDLSGTEFRTRAGQFLDDRTFDLPAVTMLAALAIEGGPDDRSRRTDFDFVDSSGRLSFSGTVRQLMLLVTPERLHATLFKPWQRADERWSLRFDPVEDRRYALLDRDPTASDNKSRSEWMANLLAYRALSLYPCATTRAGATTAGWNTNPDDPWFTWPLWQPPLRMDVVRSLFGQPTLIRDMAPAWLRQMGVVAVFRSSRIANGDYVNFTPSQGIL